MGRRGSGGKGERGGWGAQAGVAVCVCMQGGVLEGRGGSCRCGQHKYDSANGKGR